MAPRKKRTMTTKNTFQNSSATSEIGETSFSDTTLQTVDGSATLDWNIFKVGKKASSSPDTNCTICLGKIRNKAFTDACLHTFCFICLRRWAKNQAVCPLCKKPFTQILHNMRSAIDFDTWNLDDSQIMHQSSEGSTSRGRGRGRRGSRRSRGGRTDVVHQDLAGEILRLGVEFRRTIYSTGMMVRELQASDGHTLQYLDVTPSSLAADPRFELRITPWLTREVSVLLENDESLAAYVHDHIINLAKSCDISSEDFFDQLTSFFGNRTRHFIHELRSFVRAPFDVDGRLSTAGGDEPIRGGSMEEYDAAVVYNLADETGSEESDVEIIAPLILGEMAGTDDFNRSSYQFYHEDHSRYDHGGSSSNYSQDSPIYVPDEDHLFRGKNKRNVAQLEDGEFPEMTFRANRSVVGGRTLNPYHRSAGVYTVNCGDEVELIEELSDDDKSAILLSSSDEEDAKIGDQREGILKRNNECFNGDDNLRKSKRQRLLSPSKRERFDSTTARRNMENARSISVIRPKQRAGQTNTTVDVELCNNSSDNLLETDDDPRYLSELEPSSYDYCISEYLQTKHSSHRNDAANRYGDSLHDVPETRTSNIDRRRRKLQLIRSSFIEKDARESYDIGAVTNNSIDISKSSTLHRNAKFPDGEDDAGNNASDVEVVSSEKMQSKRLNETRRIGNYEAEEPCCVDVISDSDDDDCAIINEADLSTNKTASDRLLEEDDAVNGKEKRNIISVIKNNGISKCSESEKVREALNVEPLIVPNNSGESGVTSNQRNNGIDNRPLRSSSVGPSRSKSVVSSSQSFKKHHTGHKKSTFSGSGDKLKEVTEVEVLDDIAQQPIYNVDKVEAEVEITKSEDVRTLAIVDNIASSICGFDIETEPAVLDNIRTEMNDSVTKGTDVSTIGTKIVTVVDIEGDGRDIEVKVADGEIKVSDMEPIKVAEIEPKEAEMEMILAEIKSKVEIEPKEAEMEMILAKIKSKVEIEPKEAEMEMILAEIKSKEDNTEPIITEIKTTVAEIQTEMAETETKVGEINNKSVKNIKRDVIIMKMQDSKMETNCVDNNIVNASDAKEKMDQLEVVVLNDTSRVADLNTSTDDSNTNATEITDTTVNTINIQANDLFAASEPFEPSSNNFTNIDNNEVSTDTISSQQNNSRNLERVNLNEANVVADPACANLHDTRILISNDISVLTPCSMVEASRSDVPKSVLSASLKTTIGSQSTTGCDYILVNGDDCIPQNVLKNETAGQGTEHFGRKDDCTIQEGEVSEIDVQAQNSDNSSVDSSGSADSETTVVAETIAEVSTRHSHLSTVMSTLNEQCMAVASHSQLISTAPDD